MTDIASIITQLEQQRTSIERALAALREISGSGATSAGAPTVKRRGRPPGSKVSAEGRERQIEAMRAYWAAKKAGGKKTATKKATKKGGLTAAGRKALSENMKRRWQEKKLGKKSNGR